MLPNSILKQALLKHEKHLYPLHFEMRFDQGAPHRLHDKEPSVPFPQDDPGLYFLPQW